MKVSAQMLLAILLGAVIAGCAPETVPTLRAWQPWTRTLDSNYPIKLGASLKLEVSGTTKPLLGSEILEDDAIRDHLSQLLLRRGFSTDTVSPDYTVKLLYRTERSDKLAVSSVSLSTTSQGLAFWTSSGAGATYGLGVSIARAVGALAAASGTYNRQTTEQTLSYTHTVSIEFFDRQGRIVWKGESTWDSGQLNLITDIRPALQSLLSYLPSSDTCRPQVPEVRMDHVDNYYRLECQHRWFTCPALPYRIQFGARGNEQTEIPVSLIKQAYAFAAYVDLIETAEYALPAGDERAWKNPLDPSLWKHVTLGGQYTLGPDKRPINVLVTLTGRSSGYYVEECQVVSDVEFAKFTAEFARWREALRNYYDVYVH